MLFLVNKNEQHELILEVKDKAIELGRTPTRDEFGRRSAVTRCFGTYAILLQAASLDQVFISKTKLSNSIFERNINDHIEELNQPKVTQPALPDGTKAVISDIHYPFHNQKVIDRFIEYVGDEKPEYVIIDGDAWDMYGQAKFPRSHNVFTPKQEEQMARHLNEEFWKRVQTVNANAKCYQMLGNHDVRPLKRVMEAVPTMEHWIEEYFQKIFTFDNVTTYFNAREELIIGDTVIHHGYRSKLGDHRDDLLMNVIVGHTHLAGVVYRTQRNKVIWEMNCGLAGNPEAKGLTYTPQRMVKWTPAFGTVNKYGPQVVIV
jgi:predicted phosphodiesterase